MLRCPELQDVVIRQLVREGGGERPNLRGKGEESAPQGEQL